LLVVKSNEEARGENGLGYFAPSFFRFAAKTEKL